MGSLVSPRYSLMPWLLHAVPKTFREETLQVIDSTGAKRTGPVFQNQMVLELFWMTWPICQCPDRGDIHRLLYG
jgi:hypothetical protein